MDFFPRLFRRFTGSAVNSKMAPSQISSKPSQPPAFDVKKIAIIGAGPCGLSAAKYLKAQDAFESITIFEQQDHVGGIWKYSSLTPQICPAPQTDPFFAPEPPIRPQNGDGDVDSAAPVFPSPMYDKLHANIPGTLMQFSDKDFPKDARLFPSRDVAQQYLEEYAEDVKDMINLKYQVRSLLLRTDDGGNDVWDLEARSTVDEKQIVKETYDAVVVANGHYSTPFIPDIQGLERFNLQHPSIISHSKHYRTANAFVDKKVIVVGNGPSGMDIALQINRTSKGKAMLSVRNPTPPEKLEHTGCEEVPEIVEFLIPERGVRFKDGRVETDLDAVVFCTGFLFSYPFLPELQHRLITTGDGVHGLYKHLFLIDHPTLVFPGLNMKAVPWPLSEAQAAVFGAVWANILPLPPAEEMRRWARELYEKEGEALHVFRTLLTDGLYINDMHDWVLQAGPRLGKTPPYWDDEMMWQRSIFVESKLRFEEQGCKARTLEELGLKYDPNWKDGR